MAKPGEDRPSRGPDNPNSSPTDGQPPANDPLDELARLMGEAGLPPPTGYKGVPNDPLFSPEPTDLVTSDAAASASLDTELELDDLLAPLPDLENSGPELEIDDPSLDLPELDVPRSAGSDPLADLDFSDLDQASDGLIDTPRQDLRKPGELGPSVGLNRNLDVVRSPHDDALDEDALLADMEALTSDDPAFSDDLPRILRSREEPSAEVSPVAASAAIVGANQITASVDDELDTGVDDVAGHDDTGYTPPDELDEEPERKRGARVPVAVLGGIAVAALLGVGAYGFFVNSDPDAATPQLIQAEDGDVKVEPEVAADEEPQPGDATFEVLETAEGTAETPRVILPAPGEQTTPAEAPPVIPEADIAPQPPGSTAARPVRSVTVLADGTIVEVDGNEVASSAEDAVVATAEEAVPDEVAEAAEAALQASEARVPEQIITDASEPRAVDSVEIAAPATLPQNLAQPEATNPLADANAPALEEAVAPLEIPQQPQAEPATPEPPAVVGTPSISPPPPVARPNSLPVTVASAPAASAPAASPAPVAPTNSGPVQLAAPEQAPAQAAPAQTAPAQTVATTAGGNFVVQLASLRSNQQAQQTFTGLQSRFSGILGSFSPNIQQVDLGERGIFHRLRVGPMSRSEADSLCARYQSAGGDCFVQRQ
ncbi:MAG: SPOR domain-containing protein [Pseudomonadota bacterium]